MKTILLLGLAHSFAFADPLAPEISDPSVEGVGCIGKVTASAPTGGPLSVLFSDVELSVGKQVGTGLARLRCRIVFPVLVPEGFQVRSSLGTWQGRALLPKNSGSSASLTVRSFFEGELTSGLGSLNLSSLLGTDDRVKWSVPVTAPDAWTSCSNKEITATRFTLLANLVLRGDPLGNDQVFLEPVSLELPSFIYKRCVVISDPKNE